MQRSRAGVAVAAAMIAAWLGAAPGAAARAAPSLQALAREVGAGQGVYAVSGDGEVLVAQAADVPVHPASVSKVATTLALLDRLGPEHRFATRLVGTGPVRDGHLHGDLVVAASGDPFLVDEGALLLLQRLRARGVRAVDGRLRVRGPLVFDWQPDLAGEHFARVLSGEAGSAAWAAVARPAGDDAPLAEVAIRFARQAEVAASGEDVDLATLRSPRLLHVVKVLNGYSNNVFHHAADAIGGVATVEAIARQHVPAAMRDEVILENGAGAGTTNRLSPRAAVALLDALAQVLARSGNDLTAALPVSGVDPGTLQERFPETPRLVVGKTGTYGSVGASALAGALRTQRHGVVRFAVLNRGVAVPDARARQDAFVRALAASVGAEAWPYAEATRPDYLTAQVD
jgi:D-alanyl-D-alanine carboxypeptidase/D-alanyl-D-alanine-endopeptidase (penicillin-binding protein 4)